MAWSVTALGALAIWALLGWRAERKLRLECEHRCKALESATSLSKPVEQISRWLN